MTTPTATATNTNGRIQVRIAAAGFGMFTRFAGSTSRRALSVVTQVQPSTHTVATTPASTDIHISEFDQG